MGAAEELGKDRPAAGEGLVAVFAPEVGVPVRVGYEAVAEEKEIVEFHRLNGSRGRDGNGVGGLVIVHTEAKRRAEVAQLEEVAAADVEHREVVARPAVDGDALRGAAGFVAEVGPDLQFMAVGGGVAVPRRDCDEFFLRIPAHVEARGCVF